MNCMNCGCYIEAETEFCVNCGTQVVDDTVVDTRINPREQALNVMKSPIYLILAISWMVCLVTFLGSSGMTFAQLSDVRFLGIGSAGGFWVAVACIIVGVPVLLTAIGFLVSAVKARSGGCEGLGIAKAGFVVSMIFFAVLSVVVAIVLIILIIQIIGFDSYSFYGIRFMNSLEESAVVVFWVTVAVIVGLIVVNFVYYAEVISSLDVVRMAVEQNKCQRKTSVFAAIMCFFWGAAPLFSAISVLDTWGADTWVFALFLISYSISIILLGINVLGFRKIEVVFDADKLYKRPVVEDGEVAMYDLTDKEVSYCIHCGRTIYGSERCICEGRDEIKAMAESVGDSEEHVKSVTYCIYCGKTLRGTERCTCSESGGTPTSGGLISTMRSSHVDSVPSDARDDGKNEFFGSGGDLD